AGRCGVPMRRHESTSKAGRSPAGGTGRSMRMSTSREWMRRWWEGTLERLRAEPERGDVPGWVMVTLMTAGLVVLIWALAGDALSQVFQTAMDRVLGA